MSGDPHQERSSLRFISIKNNLKQQIKKFQEKYHKHHIVSKRHTKKYNTIPTIQSRIKKQLKTKKKKPTKKYEPKTTVYLFCEIKQTTQKRENETTKI